MIKSKKNKKRRPVWTHRNTERLGKQAGFETGFVQIWSESGIGRWIEAGISRDGMQFRRFGYRSCEVWMKEQ